MLISEKDNDKTVEDAELEIIWEDQVDETDTPTEESKVSIHALSGTDGLHTLSVTGTIKNKNMNLLVDSGFTDNFLSLSAVKLLGLNTQPCAPINVEVANGVKLNVSNR